MMPAMPIGNGTMSNGAMPMMGSSMPMMGGSMPMMPMMGGSMPMMPMMGGGMMPMMNGGMMPMMGGGMMPMMGGGMMPMMNGGTMPMMACKMSCEMTKDGMTCKMMPMDPSQMETLKACCDMINAVMAMGAPCVTMCSGCMLIGTR